MKPILKRGDCVEVQSKVYAGPMALKSAPKGSRGHIIDFCPQEHALGPGYFVPVGMLAIVRLHLSGSETLDIVINERALLLVEDASRKPSRAVRRAASGKRSRAKPVY